MKYDLKLKIGNDEYILSKEKKEEWPELIREIIYSRKKNMTLF